jgi:hypothetical protein
VLVERFNRRKLDEFSREAFRKVALRVGRSLAAGSSGRVAYLLLQPRGLHQDYRNMGRRLSTE